MHVLKPKSFIVLLLLVATLAFAAPATDLPFGAWKRATNEPILSPQGTTWESAGTFNPAVVLHNGKFVMLYRAQDASGTSRLGYAESAMASISRGAPSRCSPRNRLRKRWRCRRPAPARKWATPGISPTPVQQKDAQLCLATSRDLLHWERKGVILPRTREIGTSRGPNPAPSSPKKSTANTGCTGSYHRR